MSTRRGMRLLAAVGVAVVAELATAAPASAHTVGGVPPTDYESRITGLSPPAPGITARLLDLGRRIELTNRGPTDLTVLGYQGEAYLRIGPAGVFENVHSPAVYENRPLPQGVTATTLPAIAQPTAVPEWRRISSGHSLTWRDRRTRWEGPRPAIVQANPHRRSVVTQWAIPLRQDEVTLHLEGLIVWVPPPDPLPWLGLAALVVLVAVAASRPPWWGSALGTLLAVLIATDVVRSYAVALTSDGSVWVRLLRTLVAGDIGFLFWGLGAWAVVLLQREREGGLLAGTFAGLGIGLLGGLSDLPYLVHSQPPAAAPPALARVGVVITTGLGLGLAAACLLRLRKMPLSRSDTRT